MQRHPWLRNILTVHLVRAPQDYDVSYDDQQAGACSLSNCTEILKEKPNMTAVIKLRNALI